jgi:hypothetical protein
MHMDSVHDPRKLPHYRVTCNVNELNSLYKAKKMVKFVKSLNYKKSTVKYC